MAAAKAAIFFEKLNEYEQLTHELVEDVFNQVFFPNKKAKKAKKADSSSSSDKSEKAKKEPNAFMLFCKQARAHHTGTALTGTQLGEMWRALSETEHARYKEQAKNSSKDASPVVSDESDEPASDEEKAAEAAPSPVNTGKQEKQEKSKKETPPVVEEEKAAEAAASPVNTGKQGKKKK